MGRFHRQAKIVFQALACSGTEGGSGDGAGGCGGAWHEGRGWGLGGGQWGGWWWYEGCSRVNSESKRDALSASVNASRLELHARNYRSRRVAGETITVIDLWLVSMIVFERRSQLSTYDWFLWLFSRDDHSYRLMTGFYDCFRETISYRLMTGFYDCFRETITVIDLWLVSMIVFERRSQLSTYDWFLWLFSWRLMIGFLRDCFRKDLWLVYTWLFSWRLMIRLCGVIVFVKTYDWFMQDCFCEDLRLVYTWLFSWKHIDRQQWVIVLEHQTHEV